MFSIDPTTFQRDFIGPDAIATFSIRTSFNPGTEFLIVKMVTPEHTEIGFAVHKAIDLALQRIGIDEAVYHYAAVDIKDGANGTSVQSQHIEISENDLDEVNLSGGLLITPFHLLFLREHETPRETDIIIDKERFGIGPSLPSHCHHR
ncbi:hypothetical protein VN97_g178 [Penicillium thymicola]|uniref:Uncharacterized protein n=1 Tax=Penicillium thymicola TaxID=293382 RepID=A0AAI9XDG8_PENTH|nr:hypothetical protein VN97_g178 [Penicillium thymicola]